MTSGRLTWWPGWSSGMSWALRSSSVHDVAALDCPGPAEQRRTYGESDDDRHDGVSSPARSDHEYTPRTTAAAATTRIIDVIAAPVAGRAGH